MQTKEDLFLSSSYYSGPAEIKKLKFIYSAVESYCQQNNKGYSDLRILEVGCGRGAIAIPLASLGCQVFAFDLNESHIKQVKERIVREGIENIEVTVDNGYTFDHSRSYDIIIASEVFEHVMEPERLAGNIVKHLTDGSYFIITTPNGYGPWEMKNRFCPTNYLRRSNLVRRLLSKPRYVKGEGGDHCQAYTKRKLLSLFGVFSLHLLRFSSSDSVLTVLGWLYKKSIWIGSLDTKLADILPCWLASGWYFVFEKGRSEN